MNIEKLLESFMIQRVGPAQLPANFEDLIRKKLNDESVFKRFLLDGQANASMIVLMTATTTLVCNLFYRRTLLLYEGAFVTYIINTGVASFMNITAQVAHFQPKIIRGDYDCELCCGLKGAFTQVMLGYALPNILCFASTCAVSQKFGIQALPSMLSREHMNTFWRPRLLSVARKTRPLLLMQAVFGAALALKQHQIVEEVTRKVTREEYQETVTRIINELAF